MIEAAEREHEMVVARPGDARRYRWNGQPKEREEARAVFQKEMGTGLFLAYKTVEAPAEGGEPTYEQIRDFDPEAAEITLAPRLVGG